MLGVSRAGDATRADKQRTDVTRTGRGPNRLIATPQNGEQNAKAYCETASEAATCVRLQPNSLDSG